jgi:hypothetical protein
MVLIQIFLCFKLHISAITDIRRTPTTFNIILYGAPFPEFWRSLIRQTYFEHQNKLVSNGVIHLFDETMLSEKSLKPSLRCPAWPRRSAKGRSADSQP